MQSLLFQPLTSCLQEDEEDFDFSCIVGLLQAAQLCPAAAPLLAGSPSVLRALSSLAAVPLRKPEEVSGKCMGLSLRLRYRRKFGINAHMP